MGNTIQLTPSLMTPECGLFAMTRFPPIELVLKFALTVYANGC
jgi:hypothetical protein